MWLYCNTCFNAMYMCIVHCAVMLLRSAEQWLKLVAAWIILAARVFNAFQNNHSHDDDEDDLSRILMTNNDPVVVSGIVVVVVSGSVADYNNCYLNNSTFIFTGGQLWRNTICFRSSPNCHLQVLQVKHKIPLRVLLFAIFVILCNAFITHLISSCFFQQLLRALPDQTVRWWKKWNWSLNPNNAFLTI